MRLPSIADLRGLGLRGLILLFATVNGIATFTGFRAMMEGQELLYPVLFTIAVQGLILVAVHRLVRAGRVAARPVWLVAYFAGALASVILGYGFYFALLSDKDLARDTMREGAAAIVERLTAFERAYADLASSVRDLADRSAARAEEERTVGGTCGGPRLTGEGPRMRLRQRDASQLAMFARHFDARAQEVAVLVIETRAAAAAHDAKARAAGEAALDKALAAARALAADPRLAAWHEAVRGRLDAARAGFVDPRTGERFACPDPELEAALTATLAIALPTPPAGRPQLHEASHAADVRRAFVLVTGLLTGDPAARQEFRPALDGPALGFGLFVDLALLLLAFGGRDPAAGGGGGLAGLAGRLAGGPELPPHALDALAAAVGAEERQPVPRLLHDFGYDEAGRSYLLVPADGGFGPAAAVDRLAALLVGLGLARPRGVLRLARFPAWWRQPRAGLLGGSGRVRVYRLADGLRRQLLVEDLLRRMAEPPPVLEGEVLSPEPPRFRRAA
jgi:hypothetical protein